MIWTVRLFSQILSDFNTLLKRPLMAGAVTGASLEDYVSVHFSHAKNRPFVQPFKTLVDVWQGFEFP